MFNRIDTQKSGQTSNNLKLNINGFRSDRTKIEKDGTESERNFQEVEKDIKEQPKNFPSTNIRIRKVIVIIDLESNLGLGHAELILAGDNSKSIRYNHGEGIYSRGNVDWHITDDMCSSNEKTKNNAIQDYADEYLMRNKSVKIIVEDISEEQGAKMYRRALEYSQHLPENFNLITNNCVIGVRKILKAGFETPGDNSSPYKNILQRFLKRIPAMAEGSIRVIFDKLKKERNNETNQTSKEMDIKNKGILKYLKRVLKDVLAPIIAPLTVLTIGLGVGVHNLYCFNPFKFVSITILTCIATLGTLLVYTVYAPLNLVKTLLRYR